MATVNGTDYYFIDMQQASGGNITHHLLKDKAGRDAVAPTEASSTASAAHATGSYFFYNGVLYQATADIASGGTITPNTNCKAVTVGGQLGDLKSALNETTDRLVANGTLEQRVTPNASYTNKTINSSGKIVTGADDGNTYVFPVSAGDTAIVTGGSVYAFYAENPTPSETVSVDGTRHLATLNNTEITMPTGANYLAIKHTSEPFVIIKSVTVSQRVTALEAEADDINGDLDIVAAANGKSLDAFIGLTAEYIETGTDGASNYYKSITALDTTKTYTLLVTVPDYGEYTIQAGSAASAGSMVDTIYTGKLLKGENIIRGYTPTGAWTKLRNDKDVTWSVKIYAVYAQDVVSLANQNKTDIAKAPRTLSISKATFTASPYSSKIGNLDNNSIVNIGDDYGATDYPFGQAGNFTVITTGVSSSTTTQIAVRSDGRIFSRRKLSSVNWNEWSGDAVDYSRITVFASSTAYTDFNDFPIGSIITVYNAELAHAPDGFINYGHDNITSVGTINGNVLTFATTPTDPRIISQICIYNGPNVTNPAVATRTAVRQGSSAPYTYTWTSWAEFSYNGTLHATNRIIDGNNYAYTLPSADLDDLPLNSIYHLDFNCYDIIAHNPVPGQSCSVMTFGFTNNSRHALSQICVSRDPDTYAPQMFVRYCVQVGTNQYQWSPWGQLAVTPMS